MELHALGAHLDCVTLRLCHTWIGTHLDCVTLGLCHTWIGAHLDWVTLRLCHTWIGAHLDWGTLGLGHTWIGAHLDWGTLGLEHTMLEYFDPPPPHTHIPATSCIIMHINTCILPFPFILVRSISVIMLILIILT